MSENTFIVKILNRDDLYYIIPESLEKQFNEFEDRLKDLNKDGGSNYVTYNEKQNIYEEFDKIFDEYLIRNISRIKGVIERE